LKGIQPATRKKAIDSENEMRGLPRNSGLMVGRASGGTFEMGYNSSKGVEIVEPLLAARRKFREGP